MRPLPLGAATLFYKEQTVSEALEGIARHGFDSAEVWIEHLSHSGESPGEIVQRAKELNLLLTAHATSYDLNTLSTNLGISEESRAQVEGSLQAAAELGARVLVVHPGRRSSTRDRKQDFWPALIAWAEQVDRLAEKLGVRVGMELMEKRPKEIFMLPEDARRFMEHGWSQTGLTIDTAHMNTHEDPLQFLRQLEPEWIAHVHLSDNNAERTHVPLGQGEIDLPALLTALRAEYAGIVSLEGYVPGRGDEVLSQNMDYLRKIGFA